jgi:hypothetical protein
MGILDTLKANLTNMEEALAHADTENNLIIVVGEVAVSPDFDGDLIPTGEMRNTASQDATRLTYGQAHLLAYRCSNGNGVRGHVMHWRTQTEINISKLKDLLKELENGVL